MKNYVKPDIAFQSLQMAASVGGSCAHTAEFDPGICPAEIPGQPGLTLFLENSECMVYSPEMGGLICYHVPTADSNVFES